MVALKRKVGNKITSPSNRSRNAVVALKREWIFFRAAAMLRSRNAVVALKPGGSRSPPAQGG